MFKRSTKITALLVAAASIISTVPAMAATKLANKEGTVENAVAFKDGKYLYEGYRTDDDDKGLYFNAENKDKVLDDATEFNGAPFKFNDKYVVAYDGNDEYVVDMSTGKVTDDDTYTDLKETATTKLVNKLKKTDRYEMTVNGEITSNATLGSKVEGSKFGDVWYEYTATTSGATGTKAYGYTNESGTYIDASHELNIYAYNNGDMKKIENVGDTENGVKLADVKRIATLGQDDKYIYALIEATLENAENIAGESVNKGIYVQKISKAQGDKEKDAYLPKSSDCFQIAAKSDLQNGDVNDAYEALLKLDSNSTFADSTAKVSVVDGALYVTFSDDGGEKVKTIKVVLKTSEKLNKYSYEDVTENGTTVRKYTKESDKVDGHVAKKDGDVDTKADDWSIDTNGTVWAIYNGEIKKSVKKASFETVYTCDRSLDRLDVYDESNLIAWDKDGDVYTNVTEGSKAAQDEAEEIVGDNTSKDPVKTGWVQATDGTWTLIDVTGAKVTGWANVGGVWYYMDKSTTVMKTGWVNDGGTWYYCNASGAMQTGWLNDAGTWYYLQSNGAMKTGWLNDNGTWYYLNANGSMAANTTVDGYVLGANGAWIR